MYIYIHTIIHTYTHIQDIVLLVTILVPTQTVFEPNKYNTVCQLTI